MAPRQTPPPTTAPPGGRTSGQAPTFEDVPVGTPSSAGPAPLGGVSPEYRVNRPPDYSRPGAYAHGYSYSDPTRVPGGQIPPTFYEGAEFRYYGQPPADIARLQGLLSQAGLLDPSTYQPGFIGGAANDPTIAALRTVMGYANRAGFATVEDALRDYIGSGQGALGASGYAANQPGRLPAPTSNADDLRRVFRAAVIDTLGTGWTEAQINAMVDNYQAAERGYNAAAAAGEPINEQVATPETFAITQASTADPAAAQTQEFLTVAQQFNQLLSGWSA